MKVEYLVYTDCRFARPERDSEEITTRVPGSYPSPQQARQRGKCCRLQAADTGDISGLDVRGKESIFKTEMFLVGKLQRIPHT